MKTLDEVKEISYELDKSIASQIGHGHPYLIGTSVESVKYPSTKVNFPKDYSEEWYIRVNCEASKRPKGLKIDKYLEGIFITEINVTSGKFAPKKNKLN